MPWRRLPKSSKPRPIDRPTSQSHSKWAARLEYTPPSTVPVVETMLGSKEPAISELRFCLGLNTTPISLARISLPSRISSSVGALIILLTAHARAQ